MYKNLIEEAKKEGVDHISVDILVQKEKGLLLLIEDLGVANPIYELPSALLREEESIPQALQRATLLKTAMQLKEVKAYLGHYDQKGVRHYHFVVEVSDPYSVEENTQIAHAWLDTQEAVGYPITDNLREMLDLYEKFRRSSEVL